MTAMNRVGLKLAWRPLVVLILCAFWVSFAHGAGLTGSIVVAGYGPELPVVQDLARAFERSHPGTAIDFEWDRTVKAVERIKSGAAQIAVTGHPDPELRAVPIAWDGIAIVVNFANPIRELTMPQVKALFSGRLTRWSDIDGANAKVEVIHRTPDYNLTPGFESSLGIEGTLPGDSRPARSDQKALSLVSGKDAAVTYISLAAALKAQEDGIPIRVVTIDKVEPGAPTVENGRYTIRRPVLFLTAPQPDPLTEAFVSFARSPEGQRLIRSTYVPYTDPAGSATTQKTQPEPPQGTTDTSS